MSKLFVVFSGSLAGSTTKILRTKSYARGLIKKNPLLEMKEFGNEIEVEMFIKELEKRKEGEEGRGEERKVLEEFKNKIGKYNDNSYPEYLDFNHEGKRGGREEEKEKYQREEKSLKQQGEEHQIGLITKYVVPKIQLMRHFKPSPAFQFLSLSPTININVRQNQNPGLTQINYYLQNSSSPSYSYLIGQKLKHQAELLGTLYALTDLHLHQHKQANITLSNDYTLKLLSTKTTFDQKLQPILSEFNKIQPLFQSISYKRNDKKYPQKLVISNKKSM